MRGVVSLSFLNIPLLLAPGNLANIDWFNPLWLILLQKFLAFNWKMHLENALSEIRIATVHLFTLNSCKSTAPFHLLREAALRPRSAPLAEYIAEKSISSFPFMTTVWSSATFPAGNILLGFILVKGIKLLILQSYYYHRQIFFLSLLCFVLFKFNAEKLLERI